MKRLLESMFVPEAEDKNYEIRDFLGKGGFGQVHKVLCRISGVLKAVKKLDFDTEKQRNESLLREINNILQIKAHENILRWFDIFLTTSNQLAIVMELCDTDLEGYWKKKENRSNENGYLVAIQVTKGVVFLHTHDPKIIHRDLKPQNILIQHKNSTAVVKISDFGISSCANSASVNNCTNSQEIARTYQNYMMTTSGHGTKPFMAAEFFAFLDGVGLKKGKFVFDTSLDIFALGQVLNYIFCYNDSDYGRIAQCFMFMRSHTACYRSIFLFCFQVLCL